MAFLVGRICLQTRTLVALSAWVGVRGDATRRGLDPGADSQTLGVALEARGSGMYHRLGQRGVCTEAEQALSGCFPFCSRRPGAGMTSADSKLIPRLKAPEI